MESMVLNKEEIKTFIAETSFTDPKEIKDDTMLFEEGIFDSMGLLNLISFLEENYGVQTDDTDLVEENFQNLNAIEDYVARKKG
jgi:acyl carrier protein